MSDRPFTCHVMYSSCFLNVRASRFTTPQPAAPKSSPRFIQTLLTLPPKPPSSLRNPPDPGNNTPTKIQPNGAIVRNRQYHRPLLPASPPRSNPVSTERRSREVRGRGQNESPRNNNKIKGGLVGSVSPARSRFPFLCRFIAIRWGDRMWSSGSKWLVHERWL